jgi:group II intron reverse transcriptase/maturase
MVVKRYLEPEVDKHVHPDSYGYRPGKSAIEAVGQARERCWRSDWVLDLDIQGVFDNIDHALMMRAVKKHTDCPWVLLYIERWLKAPVQMPDGTLVNREKGTPQGGVVSPLLANLFLHYTFDVGMQRNHPDIPFERYADDGVPLSDRGAGAALAAGAGAAVCRVSTEAPSAEDQDCLLQG